MSWIKELAMLCIDWMLHAGWQAALVALIVFAILKLGQNQISSQFRYALLLIVLPRRLTTQHSTDGNLVCIPR